MQRSLKLEMCNANAEPSTFPAAIVCGAVCVCVCVCLVTQVRLIRVWAWLGWLRLHTHLWCVE